MGKASGLAMVPKLKYEHLHLTSFSKMRVDLAAQVHMCACVCVRACVRECVRECVRACVCACLLHSCICYYQ